MNEETKYAMAEVVGPDGTENWMFPIESKAGHVAKSSTLIRKESQAEPDTNHGAFPWVEPRLKFKDLLAWLDMNIWHRRCVSVKAACTVGLGFELYTEDEDKEHDAAYEAIMDFLMNPNEDPLVTFDEIAYRSMIDFEAFGNMVNELSRTFGDGIPGNLYHQRMVNFRRARDMRNGGFFQIPMGVNSSKRIPFSRFGQKITKQNEIMHFYEYDPASDYYGMPAWVPALADMVLDRSSVEFNINLFRNQLVAKFAVVVEGGKLDKTSRNTLQKFLSSQAQGIKNAGKTLILSSDDKDVKFKIEKLEMDFGDKQNFMGKTRELSRDMIVSAHGVPPRMVGIVTAGQLGGGSEAAEQLKIFEDIDRAPVRKRLNEFYNRTLIQSFGDHKWKFRFKGIDTTDPEMDAKIATMLKEKGIILPEEARQDVGKPPLDDEAMERLAGQVPMGGNGETLGSSVDSLIQMRKRLEASDE